MLRFVIFLALAAVLSATDSGPVVRVTGGKVRGAMLEKGAAVFKGIPYAQPPVGELRWREPIPVKAWTGVREVTAFGPVCAQRPGIIPNAAEISREDCLYLNVWTSEWPSGSRRPVMIWIPGGGNSAGGSSSEGYDGEPLAKRGIVLVTINYRLGSFGFFAHPALTNESPHHASGNQGILDQIAALKWVRDNIAGFGGDPNNVTIFGESAGSLDVSVLMTSPLAKGLFRRVIGESGAVILVGDPLTLRQAEQRGVEFAARWKLPPSAPVQDLRAVPAATILAAEPNYNATPPPNLGITVDGYVFPKPPEQVFASGQEHRVALLLGSNSREQVPGSLAPQDLAKAIEQAYGPLAPKAQALYVGTPDPLYGTPVQQWATDTSFRCSAVVQLMWHAAAGNASFEYEFARFPPGRETLGATHASELAHVFGTVKLNFFGVGPPAKATAVDSQISDVMQQYWTNFAKTGDPNGGSLPRWPEFDSSARAYVQFTDAGPVPKEGLRRPFCDLFIENAKRLMPKFSGSQPDNGKYR
jgi:para-nitrobenzyl esterase